MRGVFSYRTRPLARLTGMSRLSCDGRGGLHCVRSSAEVMKDTVVREGLSGWSVV